MPIMFGEYSCTAGSAKAELAPTGKPLSAGRAAGWARAPRGDGWKRAAGTDRNVIEARVQDEDHDCDTTGTYQAAPQHAGLLGSRFGNRLARGVG